MASRFVSQRALVESAAGGGAKVWQEIIKLSQQPHIVSNLGQGFPDFAGARVAREAAARVLEGTDASSLKLNQYSPVPGTARLRAALLRAWKSSAPASDAYTEEDNVVVTTSGTEGLYATMQACLNVGDEVLVMQPYFPWYVPCVRMAGATPVCVSLEPGTWRIPFEALERAVTVKTKAVIVNTPHNPTGHVASAGELERLSRFCVEHNLLVVSDEVYEPFVFKRASETDGARHEHVRIAHLPGMQERTVTIGSASKMFSLTGWRVGFLYGPKALVNAVNIVHSYNSYCAPTPLQDGVAAALEDMYCKGDSSEIWAEIKDLRDSFEDNARLLVDALRTVGVESSVPDGGYFLVADVARFPLPGAPRGARTTDVDFSRWLATCGVICVPMSCFYSLDGGPVPDSLVRFAICKRKETILKAVEAIRAGRSC